MPRPRDIRPARCAVRPNDPAAVTSGTINLTQSSRAGEFYVQAPTYSAEPGPVIILTPQVWVGPVKTGLGGLLTLYDGNCPDSDCRGISGFHSRESGYLPYPRGR